MRRLIASIQYAVQGLRTVFTQEANFRIHLIIMLLVIALGLMLAISAVEWTIITLSAGLVISMECINSALEYLADFVSSDIHPQIKKVKDAAAAAVLVTAISAAAVGLFIFIPKISNLL